MRWEKVSVFFFFFFFFFFFKAEEGPVSFAATWYPANIHWIVNKKGLVKDVLGIS